MVLNFHRVRDEPSDFHEGLIEVNSRVFREHLDWLRKRARFVHESELPDLRPGGQPKLMLTFDDGYSDVHDVIAPLLEELKIPAIFFVAPGMLDRRSLGGWDRIAYLVKKFPGKSFRFRGKEFSLERGTRNVYVTLGHWNQDALPDQSDEFVAELAAALGLPVPSVEAQSAELLTWDQVRDLERRGFTIGCHGFSHRVLSSLSLDDQNDEILLGRARLTAEGLKTRSFAYPYGDPYTYSWETRDFVRKAGFEFIFSFSGRAPRVRTLDRTQIDRVAFKSTLPKYNFMLAFPEAYNLVKRFRGGYEP